MNKLKSYWADADGNEMFPTLAAARQALFELAEDPGYRWYFNDLFLFHIVDGHSVSMIRVVLNKDCSLSFTRPQLL